MRHELWNGNRESWSSLLSRDPDRNIIRWSWTTYDAVVERYERAMSDPDYDHLDFVRLRSRAEVESWLGAL